MMKEIIALFGDAPIKTHIAWIVLAFALVIIAMVIDLVCGIRKAKEAGIARTSTALKKTADKAVKYFVPMLSLACIDIVSCWLLPIPVFTLLFSMYNLICEGLSVMENTHKKAEIRDMANTVQVVIKNKDDFKDMVGQLIDEKLNKELENENEQGSQEQD